MFQCGGCSRHVRAHESSCPFCGAALSTTPAPRPALTGMVLSAGLSLLACSTGPSDEGASTDNATSTESSTQSESSETTVTTTMGDGDGDVTTDLTERGAEAYGAPELPCDEYNPEPVVVGDNPVAVDANPNWIYQSCGGGGTPSLYAFTPEAAGDYEFAVIDADFSPVFSLIGLFCDPPDEYACALAPETLTQTISAGTTVHIAIDEVEGAGVGSAVLSITPVAP